LFVVVYCKGSTIGHVLTCIPSMIAVESDAEVVIGVNASTDHAFVSAPFNCGFI
jgi:hypothetical protein